MLSSCDKKSTINSSLLKKPTNPVVKMETSMGDLFIELYPDEAPISVENFLNYVSSGFYKNTIFHRVIDGFMIQGGGFESGLTEKTTRSPIKNEAFNGLSNLTGTLAMARTQIIDSATSQFFINVSDNTFLDHQGSAPQTYGYAVFGNVVEGMDIVNKIKQTKTTTVSAYSDVPVSDILIHSVFVIKK